MNGPPNVGENKRSAPGPSCIKNGMYSSNVIKRTPPAIERATLQNVLINPFAPFIEVYFVLFLAKIAELFKT